MSQDWQSGIGGPDDGRGGRGGRGTENIPLLVTEKENFGRTQNFALKQMVIFVILYSVRTVLSRRDRGFTPDNGRAARWMARLVRLVDHAEGILLLRCGASKIYFDITNNNIVMFGTRSTRAR